MSKGYERNLATRLSQLEVALLSNASKECLTLYQKTKF